MNSCDREHAPFLKYARSLVITSTPDRDGRVAPTVVERVTRPTIDGNAAIARIPIDMSHVSSMLPICRRLFLATLLIASAHVPAAAQSSNVKVEVVPGTVRAGDHVEVRVEFQEGAFVSGYVDAQAFGDDDFKRQLRDPWFRCPSGRECVTTSFAIRLQLPPGPHNLPVRLVDGGGETRAFTASFRSERPEDSDRDGMPDVWEQQHGFDPTSTRGDDGPDGDPDGDGVSNRREFELDTFPRGRYRQHFTEGSTGDRQQSWACVDLFQPQVKTASARVTFVGDDGRRKARTLYTNPSSSTCGLYLGEYVADRVVHVVVESDEPVVAERYFERSGIGSNRTRAGASLDGPSREWHFADGVGAGVFDTFLLTFNPQSEPVEAEFIYYRTTGEEPIRRVRLLQPGVRTTVWVNQDDPEASGKDMALTIRAAAPILVERAWRRDPPGRSAFHDLVSAGAAAATETWYFPHMAISTPANAEWATSFAVANPGDQTASIQATLYGQGLAPTSMQFEVGAFSRETLTLDRLYDLRPVTGVVSMELRSTNGVPIVAERTIQSVRADGQWRQSAIGATEAAPQWAIADAWRYAQSGLAMLNTADFDAKVRVKSFEMDDYGIFHELENTVTVPARRMRTVWFAPTLDTEGAFLTDVHSLVVTSLPDEDGRVAPIVVERTAKPMVDGDDAGVSTLIARPAPGGR